MMDIINISIDSLFDIQIKLNWLAFIAVFIVIVLISVLAKKAVNLLGKRSIGIEEITLGIGSSSVTLHYDSRDKAIAYKLWVELNTRKIGLEFDGESDVIAEVYDSWYEYFHIARELIKDLPIEKIEYASELIELVMKVLNVGLRPHLTKWQARYRKWYDAASQKDTEGTPPQDIQKKYPYYDDLISDLIKTNEKMIAYKDLMHRIAFNK